MRAGLAWDDRGDEMGGEVIASLPKQRQGKRHDPNLQRQADGSKLESKKARTFHNALTANAPFD